MMMRLMKTERGEGVYANMVYVSVIIFIFYIFHRKSYFRGFRHCIILFFCGIALLRFYTLVLTKGFH